MIGRIAIIVTLIAGFALAEPTTKPVDPLRPFGIPGRPTTKPANKPATRPLAEKPATKPAKFPSAAELIRQLKTKDEAQSKLLQVAMFDLDQPVLEQAPAFSLFGEGSVLTIH